jgi:hypothetical protein
MSAPVREPDDGPSKDGPVNYAPKKVRHPEPDPNSAGAPRKGDVAPPSPAPESPEPPWKRPKQRAVFVGDAAVAELRSRLALAPDRLPEPPPSPSTGPKYVLARRLAGVAGVAAIGVIGYQLGSAPPASPPRLALPSSQSNQPALASKRAVAYPPQAAEPAFASPAASNAIVLQSHEQESRDAASSRAVSRQLTVPPVAAEDASVIAAKMKIGVELMTYGEVTAARTMFQRVAEAGDAAGAFALAETYDPLVLGELRLRERILPDAALARTWYERARDLGSPEARDRISRLAQLPQ